MMRESEKTLRDRLGRELRKARVALQLTQADIAERVGTDPETISRFERGATLPSLVRLLELAEALEVTVASLLGGASPRATELASSRRLAEGMRTTSSISSALALPSA